MDLLVTNDEARRLVESIPNRACEAASASHWVVSDQGNAKAQSILWLFCWAKTGRGSRKASLAAQQVFDSILPITFTEFDARVDHQYARKNRYSDQEIEAELAVRLHGTATP